MVSYGRLPCSRDSTGGDITKGKRRAETMNAENVLKCAEYFTPQEMKIIRLVAEGVKVKRIAKALRMDKRAVQRHIDIMAKIMREVCCGV